MIVEDNLDMRNLIRSLLEDLADDIRECSDGEEALAAYIDQQPDWVLMDIKMNRMDGLAATREIVSADPGAKVMIVTAYDDAELREASRRAGACAYVVKENMMSLRRILGQPTRRL